MTNLWGREPAAIAAVAAIALNLAISFGLKLTAEQVSLINALIIGVLGLLIRQQTTPTAAPVIPSGTSVTVTTPAGSPNATATLEATPTSATTATVTATPS